MHKLFYCYKTSWYNTIDEQTSDYRNLSAEYCRHLIY